VEDEIPKTRKIDIEGVSRRCAMSVSIDAQVAAEESLKAWSYRYQSCVDVLNRFLSRHTAIPISRSVGEADLTYTSQPSSFSLRRYGRRKYLELILPCL
jgi:hypothetical protein